MSLLSYKQLCDIVDAGIMTHVDPDNINAASIDVRLGDKVLIERNVGSVELHTISLSKREPLKVVEHSFKKDGPLYLYPGEFILAHTIEMFNLPNNLSAVFKLKSSAGRIGLNHMLAGFCDAGWHGSALTLELKNETRNHCIELNSGDKIGQMVFFSHAMVPDDKSYASRGRYNKDKEVSGTKPAIVFGEEEDEIEQEVYEQDHEKVEVDEEEIEEVIEKVNKKTLVLGED